MEHAAHPRSSISHVVRQRLLVCVMIVFGFAVLPWSAYATPARAPVEDTGGDTSLPVPADHGAVVARLFDEVLSRRLPEICPLLMAAGAITHTPLGEFIGPAGFEQYADSAWSAFPGATFRIEEWLVTGDHLTIHWTMSGRHLGDFGSHAPTGAVVRLSGIAVVDFQGGMIGESWLQYDRMSLVEQIEASQEISPICPPCELP